MGLKIDASCGCHMGRIRKNNEDNFYFNGKCLPVDNEGLEHPEVFRGRIGRGLCFCVFDGMGGENYGEVASFTAAEKMRKRSLFLPNPFISTKKYLARMTGRMNEAVVRAQNELGTGRMGSTSVMLYFASPNVYVCNVGDSRAYLLRDGELQQISVDHTDSRPRIGNGKAPLTQHLGIDPQEMRIDPYIARYTPQRGDIYLLCSDGISDMLTDTEISKLLQSSESSELCVNKLVNEALANGGRDNITAIVCKII